MAPTPTIFAKLFKIDEAKRLVYGRIAEEDVDNANESMDYMASKPHFQKWSADMAADTDGKNLGNVRAMHGKVAAGGLTEMNFDDPAKVIDVCAKITDDNEWRKCLEGTYTGFSIGGSYGDKRIEKMDGRDVTRYVAKPNEVSLVDRPCMKGAKFFEIQKADGTLAKVDFAPGNAIDESSTEIVASPDEVVAFAKYMNDNNLSMKDVMAKIAKRPDVDPANATPGGDYADPVNKKYPLDSEEHVKAAGSYFGMAKNRAKYSEADQKSIDARIAAAKKKFGIGDDKDDAEKFLVAHRAALAKAVDVTGLLTSLEALVKSDAYVALADFDESLPAAVALTAEVLKWMQGELDLAKVDDTVKAFVARIDTLAKFDGEPLLKVGARNNKADQQRIQAMHDHTSALGANCQAPDPDTDDASDASKVAAARDLLKADAVGKTDLEVIKLAKAQTTAAAAAEDKLQKMISAQVTPLLEKIAKLEALPAHTTVRLRAVSKTDEMMNEDAAALAKREADDLAAAKVVDGQGVEHEPASLIKQMHRQGGVSMTFPQALRS